jgi:hypothetical protein
VGEERAVESKGIGQAVLASAVVAALISGAVNCRLEQFKSQQQASLETLKKDLERRSEMLARTSNDYLKLSDGLTELSNALDVYVLVADSSVRFPADRQLVQEAAAKFEDLGRAMAVVQRQRKAVRINPAISTAIEEILDPIAQSFARSNQKPHRNMELVATYRSQLRSQLEEVRQRVERTIDGLTIEPSQPSTANP